MASFNSRLIKDTKSKIPRLPFIKKPNLNEMGLFFLYGGDDETGTRDLPVRSDGKV